MKAQTALRDASMTTANVYRQLIPANVRAALNSRTRAVLAKKQPNSGSIPEAMPSMPPIFSGGFASA
jgi:hypothetical protein